MKTTAKQLICTVCGDPMTDGWDHTLTAGKSKPGLYPKDKAHAQKMMEITNSHYTLPCICGGHISIYGTEDTWSVTCDDCGFLWDED